MDDVELVQVLNACYDLVEESDCCRLFDSLMFDDIVE